MRCAFAPAGPYACSFARSLRTHAHVHTRGSFTRASSCRILYMTPWFPRRGVVASWRRHNGDPGLRAGSLSRHPACAPSAASPRAAHAEPWQLRPSAQPGACSEAGSQAVLPACDTIAEYRDYFSIARSSRKERPRVMSQRGRTRPPPKTVARRPDRARSLAASCGHDR